MSNKTPPRNNVVLKRPRPVAALIAIAKAISAAVANGAKTFPSPTPSLATLNADIDNLDAAEIAVKTKAKGTVATRNDKLAIVVADLDQLRAYVQKIVDADPIHAETIAQAAGMALRKPTAHTKPALAVKPSKNSGSVEVSAKATTYASNEWQYSSDGGKTWTNAPSTMQARTVIANLTVGTTVVVRHRPVTKTGVGDWSQVVSMTVV